jgi:flagellar hook-length control protein FliK
MKPDAMGFSFFPRMTQQGRMDRTQAGQQPLQAQGFGTVESSLGAQDVAFNTVYLQVAQSNEAANTDSGAANEDTLLAQTALQGVLDEAMLQEILRQQIPLMPQLNLQADAQPDSESIEPALSSIDDAGDILQILGIKQQSQSDDPLVEGLTIGQGVPDVPNAGTRAVPSAEASALIGQALSEIAKTLNLNVDPGVQNLSITDHAADLSQQFSEILATLKQIAGVLDDAVSKNQQIDLGKGKVIDVPQARELASFIQVRTFRIEIGISMLGIADNVQNDLAQKLTGTVYSTIPQAIDPKTVSMPQAHVDKLFGKLFEATSASFEALVAKVRELCAKNNTAGEATVALKTVVETKTTIVQVSQNAHMPLQSSFDSQVLRKLLKIDAKEQLAAQNTEAATQAIKLGLPTSTLKTLLKGAAMEVLKTAETTLPIGDGAAKSGVSQLLGVFDGKPVLSSYRTSDDTVITQITERLHSAIRSGLTEIRLQLKPESLGEVKMRIRVEGDVVFARINVENQQVKQIVETNLQSLKESLMQQHLSCGSLEVSVGNDGWDKEQPGLRNLPHGTSASAGGAEEDKDEVDDSVPATVALGLETGRRFGANTIEYFA